MSVEENRYLRIVIEVSNMYTTTMKLITKYNKSSMRQSNLCNPCVFTTFISQELQPCLQNYHSQSVLVAVFGILKIKHLSIAIRSEFFRNHSDYFTVWIIFLYQPLIQYLNSWCSVNFHFQIISQISFQVYIEQI